MLINNNSAISALNFLRLRNPEKYARRNQTRFRISGRSLLSKGNKISAILVVLFFSVTALFAQAPVIVEGIVVNGSNLPVANVSVGAEGLKELPSVTNEEGEFTVKVSSGNDWLNISPSGGYKSTRVFVNNRTEIKVYLTSLDLESGDDNVTILGQDYLLRNIVSSFSTVINDNINQSPAISIDQYFQGRVAGMNIINRSGDPGSGAVSFTRGVNSLNASNQPLYVVDGIPLMQKGVFGSNLDGFEYNTLLGVNVLDISKATIIKDQTITTAFGSRASNGLVIIETLDPRAIQTSIEVDLRSGYSLAPANQIPQLDASQHRTLISELLFSSGMKEEDVTSHFSNLFLKPGDDGYINYQHNTNWQDLIFTDAIFKNMNVKIKGGDEIASYGLSIGYMNSKGIIKSTGYDGYNIRFVGLLNVFSWLKMNAGVSLLNSTAQLKESGRVKETSPILTSLAKSPMINPFQYDRYGQELTSLTGVDRNGLGGSNPQAVIDKYEAGNINSNFISTLGFEASLSDHFQLHSNVGVSFNVLREELFMPNTGMELYYNSEAINVAKVTNNSLSSFYNNTQLKYSNRLGSIHRITSNTGINLMTNKFQLDWGITKNSQSNDEYRTLNDGVSNLREIGGANRNWNWLSLYELVTYDYKDKYLISATVSLDGSSRVGDDAANTISVGGNPFGLFYSLGGAWRVSSESFLKNASALEELKLRLTYGRSGNDDIGESNATNYYNAVKFRETTGLIPAVVPNKKLSYEIVSQINGGVDISLWGNRVRSSLDIYYKSIDNMLIFKPLNPYYGYNLRPENGGKMENLGFDLSALFRIVDKPSFNWDVQISYSKVKNNVLEINGGRIITSVQGAEIVNMPGEQANSFYGYIFKGVYASTADALAAGLVNDKMVPYQGGDAIYEDLSGPNGTRDGIINDFDKTVIGSSNPEQFGGLTNNFRYKRWALYAFMQFTLGNEAFNYLRAQNESMVSLANQSTKVLDRWNRQGQQTDVPRAIYNDNVGNSAFSSRWIEDGSYLRLKNVSLSYTIPNEFMTFKNAQIYISATNLFTITNYLGYDPEFSYSSAHSVQGIDYGLTPQARQFIIGVKLGL